MEILTIILKWAIPFTLTGVCTYIAKKIKDVMHTLKENEASNHTMKESMVILLRSQIVSKCEKYIELGYLPDYARSCLEGLFEQYTALGGNHGVNILVDETFKLPPKKKERRKKNEREDNKTN